MIRNYVRIAWRSALKNRFFSLLNVAGLAISLAVAMLLITYGREQLGFNRQFTKVDALHRMVMEASADYNYEKWTTLPNAVGPAMLTDIPEVASVARLVRLDFTGFGSVRANNANFAEKNIYLVDSSFFRLFDVGFVEGDRHSAFTHPKSAVISASKKNTIFGTASALNQPIIVNQRDTFTVTGVFEDLPRNSSFDGELFFDIMDSWMGKNISWSNASYHTFCLLHPGAQPSDVEQKATALIDRYVPKDNQYYTRFFLQPLAKIHLHSSDLRDGLSNRRGDIATVNTVFILSLLIILIACINYMNLATARSQKNAKEVGISKVLGAHRHQIGLRFYLDTAIITLFAIGIGLLLATVALPAFNTIVGSAIPLPHLVGPANMGIAGLIWLTVTLIGGSYPALLMANIPSLSLMKNILSHGQFAQYIRQGLVVFQFACSIILIIGVFIISRQLRHVAEKDLGYQPANILAVPIQSIGTTEKLNSIKQGIQELAGTESVATLQTFPGYGESGKTIHRPGESNEGLPVSTSSSRGAVVPTLRLDLLAGSDLPAELSATDTTCYLLINEVVAAYLGYANPADAVGQQLHTEMMPNSKIAGVVRNFNFESLKAAVGGYVFYRMNRPSEGYRYFLIRHTGHPTPAYVAQVQQLFHQHLPEAAFDFQFLDDHIKGFYTLENRTNNIITAFSLIAIFIACLGLFGLAAFTAEQRKKEIGIRKVLGASIANITAMLSKQFLMLVAIALLIASPLAWWAGNAWLRDFAYRIDIAWWIFAISGLCAFAITLATVSYHAIRAATANPVESLRDE